MNNLKQKKLTFIEKLGCAFPTLIILFTFIYQSISKTTMFLCYKEKKENIAEKFNNTLILAKSGNIAAQKRMAFYYYTGSYCGYFNKDSKGAIYWIGQAAIQGDMKSQLEIAEIWERGREDIDIYPDPKKAAYWYYRVATQGNDQAQYTLGTYYNKGYGVEVNYEQALYWYLKSYENNNRDAACKLGSIYENGLLNVTKNEEIALSYFKQCKERSENKKFDEISRKIMSLQASVSTNKRLLENVHNYYVYPDTLYYSKPVYNYSSPRITIKPPNTYYNHYGTSVQPTAICNDGTYSHSKGRRGVCSKHGGVSSWR